jgi:RNA polymerase sigma-70 factor, ECF subfamily
MSTDDGGCEQLLRRGWEAGRAAWPRVDFDWEDFSRFVRALLARQRFEDCSEALQKLALKDLYLVGACLRMVPGASGELMRYLKEALPVLLHRSSLSRAQLDELCQNLIIHLLVDPNGGRPRLNDYQGRGSLLAWCSTTVLRMAIRELKAGPKSFADDLVETLGELPASEDNPEEALDKRDSLHDFKQAVHAALDALEGRQLMMLWLYICKRVSMTEIGKLCGNVHQSTVSRELESTRKAIYAETERLLKERKGLTSSGFRSLLDTVRSQMDVGLSRFLRERFPSSSSSSSSGDPEARGV